MKISEKIEIVATTLAIIAVFSLLQSPLLNTISIIFAVRLLYRYGYLKQLKSDPADSGNTAPDIGTHAEEAKRGVVSWIVDNTCSFLVSLELLSLPMMILYLISPYQTFNCIFGLIVGLGCTMVMYGKIFRLMRVWVWFITFSLSSVSLMVIKALSR